MLHRWLLVPLTAAVLYGGTPALASEASGSAPAPPLALPAQVPLPDGISPPTAVAPALGALAPSVRIDLPKAPPSRFELPPPPAGVVVPHIALLLPLDSIAFGRHADAVRNGFFAAAAVQGSTPLPVRLYTTGDDTQQVTEGYLKALGAGARVVVGPLTRSGVTAIAEKVMVMVPTLALNVPESRVDPLPDFYTLSLQVEAEARQVAQLAWQEGRRNALTVVGDTPLLKRIHQAFVEEFSRLGGAHIAAYPFTPELEGLARIKKAADTAFEEETADMAFLALDLPRARLSRGYLGSLALYATSQINPGSVGPLVGFDLSGVRFLDMPWLLLPEDPAVSAYPRSDYRETLELDRFHALGIDAFRIALALLAGQPNIALDGVTGRLTMGRDRHIVRGLTAAQFSDGKLSIVRGRQ